MKYGSLTRLLTVIALPIFIDTLLVMTLGAADTFMLTDNEHLKEERQC